MALLASVSVLGYARQQVKQQTLENPAEIVARRGPTGGDDVSVRLKVALADNVIPNPATGQTDKVNLRSYNGALIGPTIRVKPGDTLKVRLENKLDPETCAPPDGNHNIPNCFNTTNLHTHGLHVSPAGNSDNVLLELTPLTTFDFEFCLPKDHPAGTFWYHPHRHGSTALQVSSGMAGALIINGERQLKDKTKNGIADIDTILKHPGGKAFDERIFLFQQIPYACFGDDGKILKDAQQKRWVCPEGKIGEIKQYDSQFGAGNWPDSGRYTMINGTVQVPLQAPAGKIERWRMIHGGVRDSIKVKLTRSKLQLPTARLALTSLRKMTVEEQEAWTKENCLQDQVINQWEFAVDGVTRKQITEKQVNTLHPGYRSDALVFFDKPGIYCVIDDAAPSSAIINSEGRLMKDQRLLTLVEVRGGATVTDEPRQFLLRQLIKANTDLPPITIKALEQLNVAEFAPYSDILDAELTGAQNLTFNIDHTTSPNEYQVNGKPYDPGRIDRTLKLGAVEEWTITSEIENHPFHIHVNPFQIVRILNRNNEDVTKASADCGPNASDRQYCDQIGVFRDTILIKRGYKITIRSRYERYIGDFVLHCHILDHEDRGMMQNVRIVPSLNNTRHSHK